MANSNFNLANRFLNNSSLQLLSVMAKGLNDAGRGLNVVVIGNGKEILKTAHFDTYQEGLPIDFSSNFYLILS